MNTIIAPEGIKGENLVYPTGICCTDTGDTATPDTATPVMKIGNSIEGKKITAGLDMWNIPTVNVIVGNGKYSARLKAKIDTGAYHNHISSTIAEQMSLNPVCSETHNTPYGKFELPVYRLFFAFDDFPDTHFVCDMPSIDFDGVDMLIGMQFISEFCDLYIFGKKRKFELLFR